MLGRGGRKLSRRLNLNVNSIVHFQKEIAGVLESPFDVWNGKFRGGLDLAAGGWLDSDRERQVMILAVETNDTGKIHLRRAF